MRTRKRGATGAAVSTEPNTFAARRFLAFLVVTLLVAIPFGIDRFAEPRALRVATVDTGRFGPVATKSTSPMSIWFCAGGLRTIGTATDAAVGSDLLLRITNPSEQATTGTITFVGDDGATASIQIPVGSRQVAEISAEGKIRSPGVGAIAEFDRGGVVVDQRLSVGTQQSITPCESSASSVWHFASGTTVRGATTKIGLLNPFAEDAVVDVLFSTERGVSRPSALQGFVIPAQSYRVVDVNAHARRRDTVSTSIRARVGRFVAVQRTRVPGGLQSLVPGAPAPGDVWYFPAGFSSSVREERYAVYNPTNKAVTVEVSVLVPSADIEPFVLDLAPRAMVELLPREETRIPQEIDYSTVFAAPTRSIVVHRTLTSRSRARRGTVSTLGGRRIAARWLISDVQSTTARDDRIAIVNPTDTPTTVTLELIGDGRISPVANATELVVQASGRLDVRLGDFVSIDGEAIRVTSADVPIVVERSAVSVARPGNRPPRPAYDGDGGNEETVRPSVAVPTVGVAGRWTSGAMAVPLA